MWAHSGGKGEEFFVENNKRLVLNIRQNDMKNILVIINQSVTKLRDHSIELIYASLDSYLCPFGWISTVVDGCELVSDTA